MYPHPVINPEIEFRFETLSEARVVWKVPESLSYFRGHFPGNPVLPAVAMIDATVHAVRLIEKKPAIDLTALKSAKFTHPVTPGMSAEIELTKTSQNSWKAAWKTGDLLLADLNLSVGLRS